MLAVDFGERRIGLAATDDEGRMALPLKTIIRRSDRSAIAEIRTLAAERAVEVFVIGEPLTLDGVRGQAAERVRRFGARLAAATGLPVTYVDEALTSVEARRRLRATGVDLRKHPERLDAVAAQLLLEEALARQEQAP